MIVNKDFFLSKEWSKIRNDHKVVIVSGGYDFLHAGHLNCIDCAKYLGTILVIVVNGNDFLIRKHGFYSLDEEIRAEKVDNLKNVDYTIIWRTNTQYVDGAISLIQPHIFAKGATMSGEHRLPPCELVVCEQVGCVVQYGVGGHRKEGKMTELRFNFRRLEKWY